MSSIALPHCCSSLCNDMQLVCIAHLATLPSTHANPCMLLLLLQPTGDIEPEAQKLDEPAYLT